MLRERGHDDVYAAESAPGESDAELMRRARMEGRLVLTDDRDFGLLAEREPDRSPVVVLLRLNPLGRLARARRVADVLNSLSDEPRNELLVIEPSQVRRRPYRP